MHSSSSTVSTSQDTMIRKTTLVALLLVTVASVAFAFSPTGHWKGTIRFFGSPTETFLTFNVSSTSSDDRGTFLTGTMALPGLGAELDLLEGRARGDSVSFLIDLGGSMVLSQGRVVGDTLYLTSNFGGEALNTFVRVP